VGANWETKSSAEIEKHLNEASYKVVRAECTESVFTSARDSRPNLIVLDTQIPGSDSLTVLEKFKADAELRDIPVVIVCALKDREKALELGAAGCVVPPITSNVLLGTVKTAFINYRKRMERSRLAKTANTTSDRSVALSTVE
jgi:DNA-binding response OmpR family regulator